MEMTMSCSVTYCLSVRILSSRPPCFFPFAMHQPRADWPERGTLFDLGAEMRYGREQDLHAGPTRRDKPDSLAEGLHQPRNLGAAAAGQHDEHRTVLDRQPFAGGGPQ